MNDDDYQPYVEGEELGDNGQNNEINQEGSTQQSTSEEPASIENDQKKRKRKLLKDKVHMKFSEYLDHTCLDHTCILAYIHTFTILYVYHS